LNRAPAFTGAAGGFCSFQTTGSAGAAARHAAIAAVKNSFFIIG
jgi:hypothetical protein